MTWFLLLFYLSLLTPAHLTSCLYDNFLIDYDYFGINAINEKMNDALQKSKDNVTHILCVWRNILVITMYPG